MAASVRLKRGDGAGCMMPSTSTKVLRALLCGCSGASKIDSTGAKQTSVPSMISRHSSRVFALEDFRKLRLQIRPGGPIHLRRKGFRIEARLLDQQCIELGLDGTDADVFTVRRLVGVVEVRAAVEQVGATLIGEPALSGEGEEHRHERCRAVDHGRVHHLGPCPSAWLRAGAHHAVGEEHPAAAKIADEVERADRRLPVAADRVQRTGKADVVDVVTGRLGHGAVLPPALMRP